MSISEITTNTTGQIGVNPRIVKVVCDNTLTEVTTAGFLPNNGVSSINAILPTDIVLVKYLDNISFFKPSISATGVITLSADSSDVILPTTANYIATFANTDGGIKNGSSTATNPGNVNAGLSGTAGSVSSFPSTESKGSLKVSAVANTGDTVTTISNVAMGQASVVSIPDPAAATANFVVAPSALVSGNINKASGTAGLIVDGGLAANKLLTSGITTPDVGPNLVTFNITVGQAALASAGHVALITSSGSKQYKILNLQINKGGTNFSGGGGDRLGQVTDGTTVYSVVPATNMQTLVNSAWGISTPLPFPASAATNTSTAAGANLYFAYSGGTADYTAGSIVVSGVAERVA